MSLQTAQTTKFAFHVHKPKALMLAETMARNTLQKGYDVVVTESRTPLADRVGIFYGVVPETYAAFCYYRAEGRAIYLDNGWLSTKDLPTFRFSWNSIQPFLQDMPLQEEGASIRFGKLPVIRRKPEPDLALLVLQSEQYFWNLRLGYSREDWRKATTRLLELKGYRVISREKPTKRDPEADTLFDQLARAGIVVSLNSAASLKALRYGIPSYCLLDCTLSPYAPVKLPECGKAGAAAKSDVNALCHRLASYEIDKRDMGTSKVFDMLLAVPPENRRGYFYGKV